MCAIFVWAAERRESREEKRVTGSPRGGLPPPDYVYVYERSKR